MSSGSRRPAIEVRELAKSFYIYKRPSDVLMHLVRGRSRHGQMWALNGVSFEVPRGQVVGIVGRNGAGKTTLLKILAGTMTPTGGSKFIDGRISAILELGTGFHPEFSGRENIYMGGLCLGLMRKEIDERIESIIDFSELRDVIDQPFKSYSSGMKSRLTFSTVASVDPDVLIVDEALSVGDARFQLKSFDYFQGLRKRGKTILLVSHNPNTITTFCDRAILLEKGQILQDGDPKAILGAYHQLLFGMGSDIDDERRKVDASAGAAHAGMEIVDGGASETPLVHGQSEVRFGTRRAEIVDLGITNEAGERVTLLSSGERYRVFMKIRAHEDLQEVSGGFLIRSRLGVDLFGIDTTHMQTDSFMPRARRGDVYELTMDVRMSLAAGEYFLTFSVARPDGLKYDCRFDALHFQVIGTPNIHATSIVNLEPRLGVKLLAGEADPLIRPIESATPAA